MAAATPLEEAASKHWIFSKMEWHHPLHVPIKKIPPKKIKLLGVVSLLQVHPLRIIVSPGEVGSKKERKKTRKRKKKKSLEVTQNAIKANEKSANSITEANENGSRDSALKGGMGRRGPL